RHYGQQVDPIAARRLNPAGRELAVAVEQSPEGLDVLDVDRHRPAGCECQSDLHRRGGSQQRRTSCIAPGRRTNRVRRVTEPELRADGSPEDKVAYAPEGWQLVERATRRSDQESPCEAGAGHSHEIGGAAFGTK